MTEQEFVKYIGPLAQADMKKSGVLASVTAAQAILESGYGSTDLAKNANNFFGMKRSLSGNSWPGSTWDGVSVYTKRTPEDDGRGNIYYITADFRKYPAAADSVADHSAYLLGAMNGSKKRYAGLKGETDPAKAIAIIKNGGYATDTKYVGKILSIIERYNLTQYDKGQAPQQEGEHSMEINIIKKTGTHGLYTSGRGKDKYLVIHYTAGVTSRKGAARDTAAWFANPNAGGTADYIVDDEEIVQYNPDPAVNSCWAVGGGLYGNKGGSLYKKATNLNCISIEICSSNKTGRVTNANDGNWYFTDAAIANAVKLAKYLMSKFNIPIDRVIRHYDVNGKPCPGIIGWNEDSGSVKAWEAFKAKLGAAAPATPAAQAGSGAASGDTKKYYRVRKSWKDANSQKGAYKVLKNAKDCADQNPGYFVYDWNGAQVYPAAAFKPYMVRVDIADLNIRKGPGTNNAKVGKYTGRGTFTIVEEADGPGAGKWGLLKSYQNGRDGWISLDYAKRV